MRGQAGRLLEDGWITDTPHRASEEIHSRTMIESHGILHEASDPVNPIDRAPLCPGA
jgi:hypothetical protein